MAARAQAALFAAAGIVGALGVLLPHPARFNAFGLLVIQGASLLAAAALVVLNERTPRWVATCGPFCATAMTSLAIAFTGRSTSAYLLFYLWVALYAFYFLSGPQERDVAAVRPRQGSTDQPGWRGPARPRASTSCQRVCMIYE